MSTWRTANVHCIVVALLRRCAIFADRSEAGRKLGERLVPLQLEDAVVLGLPRGGVPVARQVADVLGVPLDVIVVRKLGVPSQPELAFGAVGEGGVRVFNDDVLRGAGLTSQQIDEVIARELEEVESRAAQIRAVRARLALEGCTSVVVDDGIATGATARAACQIAVVAGARRVIVAVPVAPSGWQRLFGGVADECVAVETPRDFMAVGIHYADFRPTSDREVLALLAQSREPDCGDSE